MFGSIDKWKSRADKIPVSIIKLVALLMGSTTRLQCKIVIIDRKKTGRRSMLNPWCATSFSRNKIESNTGNKTRLYGIWYITTRLRNHQSSDWLHDDILSLRGTGTLSQNWAYFACYLYIFNMFPEKNMAILKKKEKMKTYWHIRFRRPSGFEFLIKQAKYRFD